MTISFAIINTPSPAAVRPDIGRLLERGDITMSDVAGLRRSIAEAALTMRDVEALFMLDRSAASGCPDWASFFIEAVTDFIVWQARPTGVIDHAQAEWLIGQVDRAATLAAFAILINVLAEADRVPAWLAPAARARAATWPDIAGAAACPGARRAA